jgi:hypothetical protein
MQKRISKPSPPTAFRRYEGETLLGRLQQIEAEHPGMSLWVRYVRRLVRIYARDGQADFTLPLTHFTLPDRILARDSLQRLAKLLTTNTFTTN